MNAEGTALLQCRDCKQHLPVDLFPPRRRSYCRACHSNHTKRWQAANPGYWLKRDYGLERSEVVALDELQSHECAICRESFDSEKRFPVVDHDHSSGRVRGLLCHRCNAFLGKIKDSQDFLMNALEYLRNPPFGR